MLTGNIVLIGLSGTGKTTVGDLLARELSIPYHDTDTLIAARARKSIAAIFVEEGEKLFRDRESAIIRELALAPGEPAVISTGGGVILREENVANLKKTGKMVWMNASPRVIVERLGNARGRPLLENIDPRETMVKIRRMLKTRASLYASAADFSVITDNKEPREVCDEILLSLQAGSAFPPCPKTRCGQHRER